MYDENDAMHDPVANIENFNARHDTDGLWMRGVQRLRHKVLYGLKSAREMYPDEMMKKSE